ncbi:hypothetical protein F6455_05230 [Proteobacteria bacterium 005FR1]|nr:hypothetical protein [Proteobacteria bacterium 005FR1]
MKALNLILLLNLSLGWTVLAGETEVGNFVAARTALLEVQVQNLRTAVDFMQQGSLSDQDAYELVGSPGFAAMDESLASYGFTVQTFYEYEMEQEADIAQWLADHPDSASRIIQLEGERDSLASEFERLGNAASQE